MTDEDRAREIVARFQAFNAHNRDAYDLVNLGRRIIKAFSSIRTEERQACAQIAEADKGVADCPYGSDKPGDPTWTHTEADRCPVCRQTGLDDGSKCRGLARNRIAAAIRARG